MAKTIRISEFILILILPFIVFYWMTPMLGELSVGNDYVTFSIDHQLALQYSLKKGVFPLFAPGFAGGHSAAALTLGQLYHPIAHIAAKLPGYWDGDALTVNTVLKLLSIGLTHLMIFLLLIRLRLKDSIAFALSFITVYNLRMLDMFRYGASLENYLGFVLLVGAMGLYFIRPTRVLGPALIIICTYLLITGGHPQIMYFGLLGAGLAGLFIPFVFPAINGEKRPNRSELFRYLKVIGLCLFAGIMLASVYTLPFYFEFIKENSARVSKGYSWSLAYSDRWSGVLNSFFRPLHSNVHGAFGSSAIVLFAALSPLAILYQKRVPRVIFAIFGVTLLVFLISLGRETPVHAVFWKLFPLADSFRTPGRINMILPVLFMFTLAWLFTKAPDGEPRYSLPRFVNPAFLLSLTAIFVYVIYNVFIIHVVPEPTHYHPAMINDHSHDITLIAYWTGLAALILLSAYLLFTKLRPITGILLVAAVIVQTGVELRWGTWIVERPKKVTEARIDKKMQSQLKVVGLAGYGMEPPAISEQMKRSILDPSLAAFYRTYRTVPDNESAYDYIAMHRKSTEAVVVAAAREGKAVPSCANQSPTCKADEIELTQSSYNRVRFTVDATEDGLMTVAFPFSSRFEADIDGEAAPVYRTNGYELGVFVSKGQHSVTVRATSPSTRDGLAVSLLTLFVLSIVFTRHRKHRAVRYAIRAAVAISGVCIYLLWNSSLYDGDNLGTRYTWSSTAFSPPDNLAFGKKASMTGIRSTERPYDYYAGKGVDGDKTHSGFSSDKNKSKQWWQVDLGAITTVDRIVIYDRHSLSKHRPVLIQVSDDGKRFTTTQTLDTLPRGKTLEVALENRKTRYIRIRSSGSGSLSLKEVEIYGPSGE